MPDHHSYTQPRSFGRYACRLTPAQVERIRFLRAAGLSVRQVARETSTSKSTVSRITRHARV